MRFFIPALQLGILSPPQTQIEDKFGGLPWGLPTALWPFCKNCGKSMGLVAQLLHHGDRLDLGRNGRCLFVFMCCNPDSECDATWNSEEGGNCSFVVEPEDLNSGLTLPPDLADSETAAVRVWERCAYDQTWDVDNTAWIHAEARVTSWIEQDDGIPESLFPGFTRSDAYGDVEKDWLEKAYPLTKLGSVPAWVQWPEREDMQFVAQVDQNFSFATPAPHPDQVGCPVYAGFQASRPAKSRYDAPREIVVTSIGAELSDDAPRWSCGGFNFGDCGCGFLFIKKAGDALPQSEFIWQCH